MVILSYYYESKYRLREKKPSQMTKVLIQKEKFFKAELLHEGFFFPHPFIFQRCLSNEKVGN